MSRESTPDPKTIIFLLVVICEYRDINCSAYFVQCEGNLFSRYLWAWALTLSLLIFTLLRIASWIAFSNLLGKVIILIKFWFFLHFQESHFDFLYLYEQVVQGPASCLYTYILLNTNSKIPWKKILHAFVTSIKIGSPLTIIISNSIFNIATKI